MKAPINSGFGAGLVVGTALGALMVALALHLGMLWGGA